MAPLITGTAFVGIVGVMLLTLSSLNAVAKRNSRRRNRKLLSHKIYLSANPGAKVISLPQNVMHPLKEGSVTTQSVVSKETV
jgi:hypothetical protein